MKLETRKQLRLLHRPRKKSLGPSTRWLSFVSSHTPGFFSLYVLPNKHKQSYTNSYQNIACGLLSFNQYGLLSSVRRIINPRFGLSSPLESGLFYLAPGAGFLIGSTIGGKISDQVVKVYIRKRNGLRLPEDRLNSSLPAILMVLPFGTLLYGWSVKNEVGGMALPIVASFIQGVGLMASFSGLNTYSAGKFCSWVSTSRR